MYTTISQSPEASLKEPTHNIFENLGRELWKIYSDLNRFSFPLYQLFFWKLNFVHIDKAIRNISLLSLMVPQRYYLHFVCF